MDSLLALPFLPNSLFILAAIAILYEMVRFWRRHDVLTWTRAVNQRVDRGLAEPEYLVFRLAQIGEEFRKLPAREPSPVPLRRDIQFRVIPTVMFFSVLNGIFFLYLGMFRITSETGSRWQLPLGIGMMLVTTLLYWQLWRYRGEFFRVRLLHEQYRLQKAADLPGRVETLAEILRYYPRLPGIWIEYAHEQFVAGAYDGARESVGTIEELLPNSPEPRVLLARFWLRRNSLDKAEEALDQAEEHTGGKGDARILLFRAVIAYSRGEREKAADYSELARQTDAELTEAMLDGDDTLSDLQNLWSEIGNEDEKHGQKSPIE